MSTRNPMNERYTTDAARTGTSKKSAASAKPKTPAASTVTIVSNKKSPKELKAEKKAREKKERDKMREEESKYYAPPTKRYKLLRRWWWIDLVAAIACTALSWIFQTNEDGSYTAFSVVTMVLAYVFIISALVIDLGPTRKERRRYQELVEDTSTEEHREFVEREQAKKEADEARKAEAQAAYDAAKAADASKKKKGLFGRKKKAADDEAVEAEVVEAKADAK